MRDKMLRLKNYFFIAISSGRSSLYLTKVYSEILWENAALISENGIFTLLEGKLIQHEYFDNRTLQKMRNITVDLKKIERINKDFRAFEPKQFLITLHAWNDMPEVHEVVKKNDPEGEFYVWWNGEAFDIAPQRLNKGAGLKHLADYLHLDLNQTMAIGNGPNDKDMIDAAGIGVTTEPKSVPGDYYTTGLGHLGGAELIDKLLSLV
jgi:HAD superfamily hydrolase (TIGR01484 family)